MYVKKKVEKEEHGKRMYVCMYQWNKQFKDSPKQPKSMYAKAKKRSNTEKSKITKANEYQSEKHPMQRFEIVYDIHKLP